MIKSVLQDKPVVVTVCAQDLAFYAPQEGGERMLKCNPGNRVVDHAVLLVGYTETEWIIKNSWG